MNFRLRVIILPDPDYKQTNIWMASSRRVMQVVRSSRHVVVLCYEWAFVENSSDCEVWECCIYREQ